MLSHFIHLTDRMPGPMGVVHASVEAAKGMEVAASGLLHANGIPVHVSGIAGVAVPEPYSPSAQQLPT